MLERKKSLKRRYGRRRHWAERAKDKCRKFTAFMFSNVGIILLVVIYMIAGAFMFITIEGGEALERSIEVVKKRDVLAKRLWNISCCVENVFNESAFKNLVGGHILEYQETIVKSFRAGWTGNNVTKNNNNNNAQAQTHWTFSAGFLYSLTVITTIGYGNIAPRTDWGKIATILYAIIGMPLFLLYLSNIGDILAKSFKWIYAKFCLCRLCPGLARERLVRERRKTISNIYDIWPPDELDGQNNDDVTVTSTEDDDQEQHDIETDNSIDLEIDNDTVTVPLTICLAIMISYILFGAVLFGHWDDLSLLNGSYFCFISLSSIGFGDIVPGFQIGGADTIVDLSSAFCAIYLLLGMALIAMCFNLMQEQVIHKIATLKRGIRRCFRCYKVTYTPE